VGLPSARPAATITSATPFTEEENVRLLHPESTWIGPDEIADDEIVVATTRGELALIASSIGEALEAIEEWEFDTRLGALPDEARALRDRINEILRAAFRPE
jgi:hypothetical protein